MSSNLKINEMRPWLAWALFFAAVAVVFVLGLFSFFNY